MSCRRQVLKNFVTLFFVASSPALMGCIPAEVKPEPFKSGKEIPAPFGCTELRKANPKGDC